MMSTKQKASIDRRMKRKKEEVLEALQKTPVVYVACERAGISKATFYRWREEDLVFQKKSDEAIKAGKALINDMAFSQLIALIKEKNVGAIKFWLTNQHPDFKTRIEIGGRLELAEELSLEERAMVKDALQLGGLTQNDED